MTDTYSLEKAKAYQKKREGVRLFELIYTPALLFCMLALPVSQIFKTWASHITTRPYRVVLLYFAFYSLSFYPGDDLSRYGSPLWVLNFSFDGHFCHRNKQNK